jgi:MGT family glycosyltransferase
VARFLFAHWEGGGNTPPMLSVVRRLVARGHAVRVLSDPCNRQEVVAAGASFEPWTRAPHREDKSIESDRLRDWEVKSPPAMVARLRDRLLIGPSLGYAEDVRSELARFPADAIVTSEMLLGPMAAAEAAGIPCVALCANVYLFPQQGVPPFGPGLLPARNGLERIRDWVIRTLTLREFGKGTKTFNGTRRALGLPPLRHPFEQIDRVATQLVLTSAAFDFQSPAPPPRLVYAGAALDDPDWTEPWTSPWPAGDSRPLVLVGFSSTFQNQADTLQRVIDAIGTLDVRAVVTAGPSIDTRSLRAAPNVHVCRSAPHSELLKEAAVVVTHAGHGTVVRALAAGVPLVCMPMGRDQNENAARAVYHGAGVRLAPAAPAAKIRDAVRSVIQTPGYRQRARTLGEQIVRDARESPAVRVLEDLTSKAKAS